MRLRLVIEYDGSRFEGWQIQARGETVQGTLEAGIRELLGRPVRVIGAGRTDSGVHALGQVAHCDVEPDRIREGWAKALNAVLPTGVAVLRADAVGERFHARHDVVQKRYRYRILDRRPPSPLREGRVWHVLRPLDLPAMRAAAEQWVGDHDFASFRGTPGGAPPDERTRRTLDRLELERVGDEIQILAEGRSFLRYMVRNLAGTLMEIGLGRRAPSEAGKILRAATRAAAGRTAPAWGLCLESITYAASSPGAGWSSACATTAPGTLEAGESSLDPDRPVG